MKTNFIFVGMLPNYISQVAEIVANKLDMFMINFEDMIQEEIGTATTLNNMLNSTDGQEKLLNIEKKVTKKIVDFENSIVCISINAMVEEDNLKKILQNANAVYLQISPHFFEKRSKETGDFFEAEISDLTFGEKDKKWVDTSKIVLDCCKLKVKKAAKKLTKLCTQYLQENNKEEA
ncbi:MAG: hypothetical protein IKQ31_02400 [Clostridia bacterium]|nr:hypothetical protein [Clostridia bacterium]